MSETAWLIYVVVVAAARVIAIFRMEKFDEAHGEKFYRDRRPTSQSTLATRAAVTLSFLGLAIGDLVT